MPAIARNAEGAVQMCDSSDFDELKKQRTEKMRNKIITCLRALRNNNTQEDVKLVDELLQNKLK